MIQSLYTYDTFKRIIDLEERRGRLKEYMFSRDVQSLSEGLKELRDKKNKLSSKKEKDALEEQIQESIANKGNVDGIRYISSRQFDGKDIEIKGQSIMEAYVFPPKDCSDEGIDEWLKKVFKVSSVRTTFLYNMHQINYVNPQVAITTNYMHTLFYQLEQQLKKEKVERID